jgi:sugar transferase EpsL
MAAELRRAARIYLPFKRTFDIVAAAIGLLLLMPLMLILALIIRWKLGSPVLFTQVRPGYLAKSFTVVKFRSMNDARDANGDLLSDEIRLTRFGQLLRAASLDELPQLWCVLRGDMSLVGPRPLLVRYLPRYSAEQARRHLVPPGITGWAQINGRNALSWSDKFALDVWYVDHISPLLDLRILLLTLWRVVRPSGVTKPGFATTSEFMGNDPGIGDQP